MGVPIPSHDAAPDEGRLRLKLTAVGAVGAGLCAVSAAVALGNTAVDDRSLVALARALMVGVPIATGLYAWHRRPRERFGPLLVAVGFGWFLTTLAESGNSTVYSIGRIAGWVVEIGLVYLVLSFPSGRLTQRVDRMLVWAAAVLVATLYLPTALIADGFASPSLYSSCDAGCPANAFFALGSEPAFVDDLVRPLREVLTLLLFLAVTARLAHRFGRATPLMERTLAPVLVVASARCMILAAAIPIRRVSPDSAAVDTLAWLGALAVPLMAAGFFVGLLLWRLYSADALKALGRRVRSNLSPSDLRTALAEALEDPSLVVVYWIGDGQGRWVDEDGRTVEPPGDDSGQRLTEVRDGRRRVAAIIHDAALDDVRDFLDAVASYALIAIKNQRLTAQVAASIRELQLSRARILSSADRERRRIERDLHDGAQQRLVALRIQLELAEELVERDPAKGIARLHELGEEVGRTLDEIRALAHGVYPALLADRGLPDALGAAARRLSIPASVNPDGVGRYSQDVESAVYFCCLEAMQNASKHASGARAVSISLGHGDGLTFEVRDDGAGFDGAPPRSGAGLTNMHDRLAAVGGALTIRSAPGTGTVVAGSVPVDRLGPR